MDIKKCESRRKKNESSGEVENFKTLIDDTRWLFQPDSATLRRQVTKGTKLNARRTSDVGISMVNDYASGVLSETITSGEPWFDWHKNGDEDADVLDEVSKIMLDRINESNFNSEMHRDQKSAACDGTALMYVERINGQLNYVHVPFGSFWFEQDFRGRPDIVWVEKVTTAGALVGEYGEDAVSNKVREMYEKSPEAEVKIIHYCAPRYKRDETKKDKLNKPYEFLTYEKDTEHLLEEGGTDMQKFIVYRVKRTGNEKLGRGPAIDTVCTMYVVERLGKDIQRGARQNVVPIWGVAASMGQNGFRMVHNDDASMMVYDDTGVANPPQVLNVPVNIDFAQKFMELNVAQMRQLFFLDYFNPVIDKKNITAYQTKEIVSKSQQMVDQIVGPLVEERFNPILKWTLFLLGTSGEFASVGTWPEINQALAGAKVRYKSRLANAQRRIRLMSIAESAEMFAMMAQAIPDPVMQYEFMSRIDWTKIPQEIVEGTNAPETILLPKKDAEKKANQYAQQMAQQAEAERLAKMADAAAKGGNAVEPNSPTALAMGIPQ